VKRIVPLQLFALAAFVAALFLLPAPAPSQKADESDEFFKSGTVLQLSLVLAPKELEAIRRDPRRYVPATLKEGDKVVYKDVGIHLKGAAGSFRGIDDKPNVTVNMNRFGVDQLFHGMDKFHLSNSLQDPSYLSELVCGELFRAAGVPASRVGHAVVSINGRRCGLFYIKEGYDKFFLKRHFDNNQGNFYDGGFLRDIDQPLQLIRTREDVKDRADLKALIAASRERDLKVRFEKMEKVLALDKFISYVVMEVITWDWDSYPLNRNNYRIYHHPKADKLTFIPSGMDQMFADPNGPVLPNFQGMIARALLETPEGKKRYLARMEEIMAKIYNADALVKRLDELQARLQPVLASINPGLGRDYPNQVNRLRHAVRQRQKSIEDQLKRMKK
jgi:spore coat protein H